MVKGVYHMARAATLARYALAFYLGATLALLIPFASPMYAPLSAVASWIGGR